jgi:hypothetical protein
MSRHAGILRGVWRLVFVPLLVGAFVVVITWYVLPEPFQEWFRDYPYVVPGIVVAYLIFMNYRAWSAKRTVAQDELKNDRG